MMPLCFVAADLIYRGYLAVSGDGYSVWRAKDVMQRLVSQMENRIPAGEFSRAASSPILNDNTEVLHPYFAIDNVGYLKYTNDIISYFGTKAASEEYKILIVGGSVAGMFNLLAGDELKDLLDRSPALGGRKATLLPQGRGGFKQPQQLNSLTYLLSLGCRPDAVINIDGFNEVALGMNNAMNDAHPVYPSLTHWGPHASHQRLEPRLRKWLDLARERRANAAEIARSAIENHLYYSAILGNIAIARVSKLDRENALDVDAYLKELTKGERDAAVSGPEFDKSSAAVIDTSIRAWTAGSRMIRAVCDADGILYFHFLQPTLHDPEGKVMTAHEKEVGSAPESYLTGVHMGYPLLRKAGGELKSGGENYYDLTGIFKGNANEIYIDNCHFGEEGNKIMARAIAVAIVERMKK